jgi:hypothetical protein
LRQPGIGRGRKRGVEHVEADLKRDLLVFGDTRDQVIACGLHRCGIEDRFGKDRAHQSQHARSIFGQRLNFEAYVRRIDDE